LTLDAQNSYIVGAVFFLAAAVLFLVQSIVRLGPRRCALRAERRFETLQHIAPSLTGAVADSTSATCARIVERTSALVHAQCLLCFYVEDSHSVLGAKSGSGYAGFLREGETYDGDTIADWVRREGRPAIVGPKPSSLPADLGVFDLAREPANSRISAGPIAGSRDTVWSVAVPLMRPPSGVERASVIGVIYADRARAQAFDEDDITTLLTIAHLAGDALARALFADRVKRDATRDQLTGLLSPAGFRRRLRDEVDARRNDTRIGANREVSLFFIDTDHFKAWNDTHGHPSGDELLRRLASMFAQTASLAHGFAAKMHRSSSRKSSARK